MKQEEIIQKIIESDSLHCSKELLSWVQQSDENREEYIRYKNAWALLQQGKEMDKKHINDGFMQVKARISPAGKNFDLYRFVRYAAIIIFAIIGGYFLNTLIGGPKLAMNEISVPNGNRSLIELPDGSKVWLTNGSKLVYPNSFAGGTREVKLQGEAFFTVAHNEQKPFIVNLGKQLVKVLGTEFSVVAYPDDNLVQVDLVSGKVQFDLADLNGNIKSYIIKPLHSLVLDKKSGSLTSSKLPDNFYRYWQEGIYEFKNESFESLVKKIEHIYSVKVIFEDENLKKNTFTGAFYLDSNIYTIMETFKRASGTPFEFSIEKNRIYLKPKNKRPM